MPENLPSKWDEHGNEPIQKLVMQQKSESCVAGTKRASGLGSQCQTSHGADLATLRFLVLAIVAHLDVTRPSRPKPLVTRLKHSNASKTFHSPNCLNQPQMFKEDWDRTSPGTVTETHPSTPAQSPGHMDSSSANPMPGRFARKLGPVERHRTPERNAGTPKLNMRTPERLNGTQERQNGTPSIPATQARTPGIPRGPDARRCSR